MVNFASNISWGYNFIKSNTLTAECQGRAGLCTQDFSTTYSFVPLKYLISDWFSQLQLISVTGHPRDKTQTEEHLFHSTVLHQPPQPYQSDPRPTCHRSHEGSSGLISKRRPRVKRDKSFTPIPHGFLAPLPYLQKVDNITWRGKIQMLPAAVFVPKKCG